MRYYTRDLVVDPHDPTQNTWYVAVANDWGSVYPVPGNVLGAFYRTTNRGQSWTKILSIPVESATISPVNPDEMYVTTQALGLWYTSNLSAASPTFTQVPSYTFKWPERVFYNPYNPNEVWVASNGNGLSMGVTNQAPVLDVSATATLTSIGEDSASNPGTLVADLIASAAPAILITDPDAGALEGLAVTGADNTHGIWQFSTDGGANWLPLGPVADANARLLAADGNTRLRLVPVANFYGDSAITFRAWDRTYGSNGVLADASFAGGSTAFSTASGAASIMVKTACNLDADGNGAADALTDGILILRYLFDTSGQWNYSDALGSGATRTTRTQIKSYLDGGAATVLDVDGNGTPDALTDGILVLRYLFDTAGQWNYSDALGSGATRTTRGQIKAFLDQYNPGLAPTPGLMVAAPSAELSGPVLKCVPLLGTSSAGSHEKTLLLRSSGTRWRAQVPAPAHLVPVAPAEVAPGVGGDLVEGAGQRASVVGHRDEASAPIVDNDLVAAVASAAVTGNDRDDDLFDSTPTSHAGRVARIAAADFTLRGWNTLAGPPRRPARWSGTD